MNFDRISEFLRSGAGIRKTPITSEFSFENYEKNMVIKHYLYLWSQVQIQ